ncbi:hypothetical protein BGZ58_009824 [Dissophora ornata]|nr:hypothetical protein BGZ58_009824 [Dissophora ornata]
MLARGAFLRNNPLKPRLSIPASKSLITSSTPEEAASHDTGSKQERGRLQDRPSVETSLQSSEGAEASSSSPTIPTSAAALPTSEKSTEGDRKTDVDTQSQALPSPSANPELANGDSQADLGAQPTTMSSERLSASTSTESLSFPSVLASTFTVLPEFKAAVDEISATTRTSITLLSNPTHGISSRRCVVAGFARQDIVKLQVTGSWENAEAARLLLLVAFDTLKPGVVSDKLTVELKFQNMIGGRKRQDLQDLMARTRTSIYLTSPLVQTANKSGIPVDSRYNEIYITGEAKQVAIAKDALSRAYRRAQSASLSCTRQVNIATRKLDWMLLNHRDKLRSIMLDNATFIAFPPLGGTHPTISVYGESNVNVERTIRTVMQLSCHFHSGSITMRDIALSIHVPHTLSSLPTICKLVSQASGAEVEYRNNGFLMFGSEIQTRVAMQFLAEVDIVKALPSEFKFSVELANEHREFISGKKNGKINRIMKATGAKIKFDQCNEYNFYVDLSSTISMKAMEALAFLQEELPAEISFFVPETYHKRIIGVGGKNIQRIMKKYGVYVKFSNSEEFATLGGYFDNLDNVVARTPSKNAVNLENLKHSVMELVNPKDKDFVSHHLIIPKQHHLSLLSDRAIVLREIHDATNATVLFPARETGSDVVTVSGPESLIQQAVTMLLSMVDEQYIFPVKFSEAMDGVLALPEFSSEVVEAMKRAWNMTLVLPEVNVADSAEVLAADEGAKPTTENSDAQDQQYTTMTSADSRKRDKAHSDHVFIFEYTRNNEDYLQNAKDLLIQFLVSHQIEVYDDDLYVARPRSSSFGESFVHFHSRMSSSTLTDLTPAQGSPDYALFDSAAAGFESTTIPGNSLANSEIRSLFTPSTASNLPSQETSSSRWSDHARHLGAFPGSPSTHSSSTSAAASNYGLSSVSAIGQSPGNSNIYSRVTPLPADPWAPSKHQHRQSLSSGSYLGPIGDLRSSPAGVSHGAGSGYYSPGGYPQTQLPSLQTSEATYNKLSGFQAPGSGNSGHRYSGGNSPVQGPTTSIGNYGKVMNHQGSPQHSSSQRPNSGSSSNRGSMQFLEEKMLSGSTFGAGYGPSLNSGGQRSTHQQQQQMGYQQSQQPYVHQLQNQSLNPYPQQQQQQYQLQQQQQQQQHGFSGQVYPSHLHLHHSGLSYPQQRQRHSSQNSAASHHTMGLGPIGGGPGSAGGSVNSDEISTEEDSDEVFDEMRNRQRMQSTPTSLFQQPPLMQQGYHQSSLGSGAFEGYSSHNSSSSSLLNRRGSAGSTHSIGFQQQQPQFYSQKPLDYSSHLNSSAMDIYGQSALVSAMEKHSLSSQPENDMSVGGGRSSQSRFASHSRQSSGIASSTMGAGLPGVATGSRFEDDRGFFSSGFGGIIGEGAHGYGQIMNGSLAGLVHPNSGGAFAPSASHQGGHVFGSFGGNGDSNGLGAVEGRSGASVATSGLSALASPFYMDSSLHHAQSADRVNEASRIVGWDR